MEEILAGIIGHGKFLVLDRRVMVCVRCIADSIRAGGELPRDWTRSAVSWLGDVRKYLDDPGTPRPGKFEGSENITCYFVHE